MKKFLLALFVAATSATFVNAAETEVAFDFTTNKYGMETYNTDNDKYWTTEHDNYTFSEGNVTVMMQKLSGSGCRLWDSNGSITFRVNKNSGITVSVNAGAIVKIVFTGQNNNNLAVNGTKITNMTWTGSESSIAFVNVDKTVQIKTMTVTVSDVVDTRKDAGLAFPQEKYEAIFGQAFESPKATKATTEAITYASDKETVATVDPQTGEVRIVGLGSARISATTPESTEYKEGYASYLLTVVDGPAENSIFWNRLGEDFTFENPEGLEVWEHDNTYGLKGSAYISSKANAAEAYAVSPVVDLNGYKNIKLDFKNAFNNYKLAGKMIDVADFEGAGYATVVIREDGATEWVNLADATTPEAFSWDFYDNAQISLETYAGKKIQVAFKYTSTAEVAGTWEVQSIDITADPDPEAGIDNVAVEAENGPVEYFNLQGVRVENPTNGLYIMRQGSKATKVIL